MAMATKKNTLDKTQVNQLINDFFEKFETILNRPSPISMNDLEKHLSRNFHITNNGHVTAKSLTEYMHRVEVLKKKYSRFEIADIQIEPLATGNKMVVHYALHLTGKNNQKTNVHIMAIATLEDNKIVNWMEVSNDGLSNWDK